MFKFSPDDVTDRLIAIKDIANITIKDGGQPAGIDNNGNAMDLPPVFQQIWNLIGQVQTCKAPVELMTQLVDLPQGRFFGNFVNRTGDEDPREYKYIMNFILAMTCAPASYGAPDLNCEFNRIIGRNKCVYGSMATSSMRWYDVLKIIFTYMNNNNHIYTIFTNNSNPDPYPDFMNYKETDPICNTLQPTFVPTQICKPPSSSSSSSSSSLQWATKNLICALIIALVLLVLLFNPIAFKLTNMLGGYTTGLNGPTVVGYSVHGIILTGLIVCLYFFFPRQ